MIVEELGDLLSIRQVLAIVSAAGKVTRPASISKTDAMVNIQKEKQTRMPEVGLQVHFT